MESRYRNYVGDPGPLKGRIKPSGEKILVSGKKGDRISGNIIGKNFQNNILQGFGNDLRPISDGRQSRLFQQGDLAPGIAQKIDPLGIKVVNSISMDLVGRRESDGCGYHIPGRQLHGLPAGVQPDLRSVFSVLL